MHVVLQISMREGNNSWLESMDSKIVALISVIFICADNIVYAQVLTVIEI